MGTLRYNTPPRRGSVGGGEGPYLYFRSSETVGSGSLHRGTVDGDGANTNSGKEMARHSHMALRPVGVRGFPQIPISGTGEGISDDEIQR